MNTDHMNIHPLAAVFPMMAADSHQFLELVDDIRDVGLIDPIVMDGDVLIDGRNRLAACEKAGVSPRFVQFKDITKPRGYPKGRDGEDSEVAEWILSKNLMRRNMTDEQRTTAWVEFDRVEAELRAKEAKARTASNLTPGNPKEKRDLSVNLISGSPIKRDVKKMKANSTAGRIAERAGVSIYKAEQAIALVKAAEENPELLPLVASVKSGEIKLADARKVLSATKKALSPPKPKPKPKPEPTTEELLQKQWAKFLKPFAVNQHKQLREFVTEKLKSQAL
jgi:hypothetical protein